MTEEDLDRAIWNRLNAEQRGKEVQKEINVFNQQVGGNHYKDMPIQPMEYTMANNMNPMQHTIIKYVSRYKNKNGIEDLEKALHTLNLLIDWEHGNAYKK